MRAHRTLSSLALALVLTLSLAAVAAAQKAELNINIYGAGESRSFIALADPMATPSGDAPPLAAELQSLIRTNLSFLPFLGIVPREGVLGGSRLNGVTRENIDFRRFQLAGADYLMTTGWPNPGTVELRVYEAFGSNLVVGKAYAQVDKQSLPRVADKFCAALMEALTGSGEFFRSTLAFVRASGPGTNRNIYTVRPTGRELRQISNEEGACLSPSWSPNANSIVFSIVAERYHYLGLWQGGSVKKVRYPGNTVIAPDFTPSGQIAVSLTQKNQPDIFLLGADLQPQRPLVQDGSINVSPSFSRNGQAMAYVSDRFGSPHIFVRNLATGHDQRITYSGYNTDPSISPDGSLVAFTRMTGGGHRIYLYDMKTGREQQITFGPGSDEQPAFAPDNYFVAFSSSRSGSRQIYLTTRHGTEPIQVPTNGPAGFPAWGLTDAP